MKPSLAITLAVLAAGVCPADPADRAILAAMRLSEQPNYAWTSVITDDARSYTIEGKRHQAGYTWVRLPMVTALAERLGRLADDDIEAVFRGSSDACVIRTERGWQTLRELPRRFDRNDDVELWPTSASSRPAGAVVTSLPPPNRPRTPFPYAEDDSAAYCNAQFAVSHPHDELAIIVSSHAGLQVQGDTVSGQLTDTGAQLLLVRDGQEHIQPIVAAGTFRLLVKGGIVVKYELRLEGILLVERKRVHVHQISTTTVRNIGTTHFEIPDEARRKLALVTASAGK